MNAVIQIVSSTSARICEGPHPVYDKGYHSMREPVLLRHGALRQFDQVPIGYTKRFDHLRSNNATGMGIANCQSMGKAWALCQPLPGPNPWAPTGF